MSQRRKLPRSESIRIMKRIETQLRKAADLVLELEQYWARAAGESHPDLNAGETAVSLLRAAIDKARVDAAGEAAKVGGPVDVAGLQEKLAEQIVNDQLINYTAEDLATVIVKRLTELDPSGKFTQDIAEVLDGDWHQMEVDADNGRNAVAYRLAAEKLRAAKV